MEEKRDSFVFYRSFKEAIDQLGADERLEVYEAIVSYALDGVEPKMSGCTSKIVWIFVKPLLDANWKKYRNGCKGREHGIKGVAPKWDKNDTVVYLDKPKPNISLRSQPCAVPITKREEYPFKDLPIEERKERFVKEVRAYESEYGVDLIRAFCDYWTEQKKDKILMRFELEKVFEIGCRLRRWATSNYKTNV